MVHLTALVINKLKSLKILKYCVFIGCFAGFFLKIVFKNVIE